MDRDIPSSLDSDEFVNMHVVITPYINNAGHSDADTS